MATPGRPSELVAHFDDVLFAPEPAPLAIEIGALVGCFGLWSRLSGVQ